MPDLAPHSALVIGVVAIFASFAINRYLGERNFKLLSSEDKASLFDQLSTYRSLGTYLPILIMGLVLVIGSMKSSTFQFLFPVGVAGILSVSIAIQILILRRVVNLNLPREFVSRLRFQMSVVQVLHVVGLSSLCYAVAMTNR